MSFESRRNRRGDCGDRDRGGDRPCSKCRKVRCCCPPPKKRICTNCDGAFFYAVLPPDSSGPFQPGQAIPFPNKGPSTNDDDSENIEKDDDAHFRLRHAGLYRVSFQATVGGVAAGQTAVPPLVALAAQLVLALNTGNGDVELATSTVGTASGAPGHLSNALYVRTRVNNALLSLRNPAGAALPIALMAYGTTTQLAQPATNSVVPITASILIERVFCDCNKRDCDRDDRDRDRR